MAKVGVNIRHEAAMIMPPSACSAEDLSFFVGKRLSEEKRNEFPDKKLGAHHYLTCFVRNAEKGVFQVKKGHELVTQK